MNKRNTIKYLDSLVSKLEQQKGDLVDNPIEVKSAFKEVAGEDSVEYKDVSIYLDNNYGQSRVRVIVAIKDLSDKIKGFGLPKISKNNFLHTLPDAYVVALITLLCIGCFSFGLYFSNKNENKLEIEKSRMLKHIEALEKDKVILNEKLIFMKKKPTNKNTN